MYTGNKNKKKFLLDKLRKFFFHSLKHKKVFISFSLKTFIKQNDWTIKRKNKKFFIY